MSADWCRFNAVRHTAIKNTSNAIRSCKKRKKTKKSLIYGNFIIISCLHNFFCSFCWPCVCSSWIIICESMLTRIPAQHPYQISWLFRSADGMPIQCRKTHRHEKRKSVMQYVRPCKTAILFKYLAFARCLFCVPFAFCVRLRLSVNPPLQGFQRNTHQISRFRSVWWCRFNAVKHTAIFKNTSNTLPPWKKKKNTKRF